MIFWSKPGALSSTLEIQLKNSALGGSGSATLHGLKYDAWTSEQGQNNYPCPRGHTRSLCPRIVMTFMRYPGVCGGSDIGSLRWLSQKPSWFCWHTWCTWPRGLWNTMCWHSSFAQGFYTLSTGTEGKVVHGREIRRERGREDEK